MESGPTKAPSGPDWHAIEGGPDRRLHPTLVPTRSRQYRRPGGPWDHGSLDRVLTEGAARGHVATDTSWSLSGGALEDSVSRVAGGLRRLGVRRGDRVAWQMPNCVESLLLYRACWRLGAVAVPVHHAAGEAEASEAVSQSAPRVLLGRPTSVLCGAHSAIPVEGPGSLPGGAAIAAAASPARPYDLAALLFTSGSTGRPKGVLHTHRGLAYKALLMAGVHGLGPGDTVLMPAPLAHISGLLNGVLLPGVSGMRTVMMMRWDPERALDLIEAESVSFMVGPPTFFVGMAGAPGYRRERLETLRLVSSGGAAVSPAFVDSASRSLGCTVKRTYGSTEAPTVATSTAGDPPEKARETEGRAVGEAELRISDPDTGRRLRPGGSGELWVRGPELFVGYLDPAQTVEAHARGTWFRTGDLATLDADGWLRIIGRTKDVMIRGGENISAGEVETALEAHPEVTQAAVVPYPDPVMGERVAAFVVAPDSFDLEEVRDWFSKRGVARFKTPERLVHMDSLPTSPTGKPDRAALRELAGRRSPD